MRRKSAKLLEPGKTYTFTIPYNRIWSDVYTGVFMTYSYRGRNQYDEHVEFKHHRLYSNYEYYGYTPSYLFNVLEGKHTGEIMFGMNDIKFITAKHSLMAKQVARGLCDRIPEDCAGIIERMLVGDKIVGQGPDRYEER